MNVGSVRMKLIIKERPLGIALLNIVDNVST